MPPDQGDYGVEAWAAETFGWERTNGDSYFDLLAWNDVKVEAKGCLRWIEARPRRRRGRFRLWSKEHERLCDDDGLYLFTVYEDTEWAWPFAWRMMPATVVSELIDGFSNHTHRPEKGMTTKVRWVDIIAGIPPEEAYL